MLNPPTPITNLPVDGNVRGWIEGQLKGIESATLLAFADDGVIWGDWKDGKLTTAHEVDSTYPELREKTLQQAYLFNSDSEIRLFRDETGRWKSYQVKDQGEPLVERQILWGDKPNTKQPGHPAFTSLLAERKGIPPQLIPVAGTMNAEDCVRLELHHMVDYTDAGEAYIAISRLAGVSIGKKAEEV